MEIKICGITTLEDRNCVIEAGADYFGVIMESGRSSRALSLEQAAPLFRLEGAPGSTAAIRAVAVTTNESVENLRALYDKLHPFAIQLHGDESPEEVAEIRKHLSCELWKVIHIPTGGLSGYRSDQTKKNIPLYLQSGINVILFDTAVARGKTPMRGGTGQTFPWGLLQFAMPQPRPRFFVAGGLNTTNISLAIQKSQPAGVDISSGVEVYPGKKNPEKVREIIRKIRSGSLTPPPAE
jgi:phosphoribosylanthranilate isomerase